MNLNDETLKLYFCRKHCQFLPPPKKNKNKYSEAKKVWKTLP